MEKMPRIFDLVVLSHEPDATLYQVVEFGLHEIGLEDTTVDADIIQRVQWVDLSLVMWPTRAQLKRAV